MNGGEILRIVMVLGGLWLMVMTILSLARRIMTETICLIWGLFSILMILGGILLRPFGLSYYVSNTGLVIILLVGVLGISCAYGLSKHISNMERRNRELSMQVSILNHEIEELWERVGENKEENNGY